MKVLAERLYDERTALWFGIPTWDPAGRAGEMSVKFAYRTTDGSRWARTSPEVPESVVWDMVMMLNDQGRLGQVLESAASHPERAGQLRNELDAVMSTLRRVQAQ